MIGQTIGRYRVLEQIGAGGMGVVYRIFDERLQRELALKVLSPNTFDNEEARRRFRKEALILSRLSHPNIQVIHDFDTHEGMDYLVAELIPGASLEDKLVAGALPEKEIVRLGMQLAQGLEASHQKGVLHRDLKPGNLRVTPDGHLKILDFGLAMLSPTAAAVTTTGSVYATESGLAGTLPYMAPEQLRGEATDERSDLYSAGAVLYEMATGRRPFEEAHVPRLTDAILHQPPPLPRNLNPKISAELERIILKCLEKDPELRYQSARELLVDLRRLEATGSSQARISESSLAAAAARPRPRLFAYLAGGLAVPVLAALALLLYLGMKKRAPSGPLQYEQVTNFTGSATTPALSPDGKMVAFIRGSDSMGYSANPGQVWIKLLPDGDAVQLTHDTVRKTAVTFSPDGSRVAYTQLNKGFLWDTWEVPVLGGEPHQLLPNASGLTWIGKDRLMFSEVKAGEGVHMGIVVSGPSRSDEQSVYWPTAVTNMAHNSALSPDGKWVLVVEMDGTGWLPCRVVPFDGSGTVRVVGPQGACTSAKWSPDGQWMYFTANTGGAFHLWRQRFPDGEPEQLTNGVTEEEGIALSADGRSLVTAVGLRASIVWVHDRNGDRQITSEGYSFLPRLSRDAKTVYYLKQTGTSRSYVSGELWSADLATGRQQRVLPAYVLAHYDISHDGRMVVFAAAEGRGSGIWIAPLDRSSPPRQLTAGGEYRAFFGAPGEIIYQTVEEPRHLMRMQEDGSGREPISPDPILHLMSVSPDGRWAAVVSPAGRGQDVHVVAYPRYGGPPALICDTCIGGFGPARMNAPLVSWSPDGNYLYVSLQFFAMQSQKTLVLPLQAGAPPPLLTPRPDVSEQSFASLPGSRIINEKDVFSGPTPSTYAFSRRSAQTNLFRIRLP